MNIFSLATRVASYVWNAIQGKPKVQVGDGSVGIGGDATGQVRVMNASGQAIAIGQARDVHVHAFPNAQVDHDEERLHAFSREGFVDSNSECGQTRYLIYDNDAGVEAPAHNARATRGDLLTVILQDQELQPEGLTVWLTIQNRGKRGVRWFGPILTAYGHPYQEIMPTPRSLYDVYPGDQYSCKYFFPFNEGTLGPKYVTCKSNDVDLVFWWARGA